LVNEYVIRRPTAYLYEEPDASGAVSDELLYGTRLFCLGDSAETQKNMFYCETSYGYRGFAERKAAARVLGSRHDVSYAVVTSPFCDVLPSPEYRYRPVMMLFRGSTVELCRTEQTFSDYTAVIADGARRYVRTSQIKKVTEQAPLVSRKRRCDIVDTALSYVGTPYRWAGKSTEGIDCSGLCFMAYTLNGVGLWRDAVPDSKYVRTIPFENLEPADLVYYKGHVVMYIGAGEYVHSSATLGGVTVSSFDESSPVFYPKLSRGILCCAASREL